MNKTDRPDTRHGRTSPALPESARCTRKLVESPATMTDTWSFDWKHSNWWMYPQNDTHLKGVFANFHVSQTTQRLLGIYLSITGKFFAGSYRTIASVRDRSLVFYRLIQLIEISKYPLFGTRFRPRCPSPSNIVEILNGSACSFAGISGLIANALVLGMFMRTKGRLSPSSMVLLNLTVTDIFILLCGFPTHTVANFYGR